MVERIAFTQSPRWRLSFSEWAWVLGSATPIRMQGAPLRRSANGCTKPMVPPEPTMAVSLPKPAFEGAARGLEGRPLGVGGPPRRGAFDVRGDLHAVGRLGGELLHDEAARLARAASMIWLDEPRNGRASNAITVRAGRVHQRSSREYCVSPQSRTPGSMPASFLNLASDSGSLRMRASCLALGRATLA